MNTGTCFGLPGKIETECLSAVMLQINSKKAAYELSDVDENIDMVFGYMDKVVGAMPGTDLIITPEFILHGCGNDHTGSLMTPDGPQMERLKNKCRQLRVWGIFGCLMDFDDGAYMYNCAVTINDKGEIVNIYKKTNPWIPVESSTPGDEIQVFEGPKGARLATIICADGDYIETWREAASKGANVICRLSYYMTPYQEAYEITNRAGAYFNRAYVLATNSGGIDEEYCLFGNSMAVNPDGAVITKAPEGIPYILKADIYPGLADYIRYQAPMGNLLWLGGHRGAGCPEYGGTGKDRSMYTFMKKERE